MGDTSRRSFLRRAVATGALTAIAGCLDEIQESGETGMTTTRTLEPTTEETTEQAAVEEATTTAEEETTEAAMTEETTTGTGGEVVEVAVGPEKRLRFDPEEVEIGVGDTVRWTFDSTGHNVTTRPGASEKIEIPDEAEPFASYEGDQHFAINEVGTTYEHTFTVPGEYVYVCSPHADQGMVGTVTVTE